MAATESTKLFESISKADLTDKTKKNYTSGLKTLTDKGDATIVEICLNPDKYIPLIRKWFDKDTSYKTHLAFILGVFKYNKKFLGDNEAVHLKWTTAFKEADSAVKARYETNVPSEKQIDGFVTFAKIIKARNSAQKGSMERVLLGMYSHIPPRRLEYAKVFLYSSAPPEQPEENYIVLKTGLMVLTNYKTFKHHGEYSVTLPKPLMADINESLEETPREWLFTNSKRLPFTNQAFCVWTMSTFKDIFNKPLTVALIRHSYINSLDFNTLSIKEKKEIAEKMGHTIKLQDEYRIIFDDCA